MQSETHKLRICWTLAGQPARTKHFALIEMDKHTQIMKQACEIIVFFFIAILLICFRVYLCILFLFITLRHCLFLSSYLYRFMSGYYCNFSALQHHHQKQQQQHFSDFYGMKSDYYFMQSLKWQAIQIKVLDYKP